MSNFKVNFEHKGLKYISSEDFSTLPKIEVYVVKVMIPEIDDVLFFKSFNSQVLLNKVKEIMSLFADSHFELNSYTCKSTDIYADENCEYNTIRSFRGSLI